MFSEGQQGETPCIHRVRTDTLLCPLFCFSPVLSPWYSTIPPHPAPPHPTSRPFQTNEYCSVFCFSLFWPPTVGGGPSTPFLSLPVTQQKSPLSQNGKTVGSILTPLVFPFSDVALASASANLFLKEVRPFLSPSVPHTRTHTHNFPVFPLH